MKKLYITVILILLPAILYFGFFFANDPHDYFQRSDEVTDFDSLIGHMLNFERNDYNGIILGESRSARIDVDKLNAETGFSYKNMSFAGCSIEEYVKLFWWCVDEQKADIQSVIIVTSFYATNEELQHDRVSTTDKIIQNPVTYAFSIDNLKDCINNIGVDYTGIPEEYVPTAEEKPQAFADHRDSLEYMVSHYTYSEENLEALAEMCDYCKENGIEVKIVLPAWWEGYYELLDEYNLLGQIDDFKKYLSYHADVYDMEYPECVLNDNYDDFKDYTHAMGDTREALFDMIIYNDLSYARLWQNGAIVSDN